VRGELTYRDGAPIEIGDRVRFWKYGHSLPGRVDAVEGGKVRIRYRNRSGVERVVTFLSNAPVRIRRAEKSGSAT
jgi:hypothetical protein